MHIKYVDLYTVSCNLEPIRIYGLVINLSITIVVDRKGTGIPYSIYSCCRVYYNWSLNFVLIFQRGLIYTDRKPLGRLCKMCNPFFNESLVTVCKCIKALYTATIFTTERMARWLTLIVVLLILAGGEGRERGPWFVWLWKLERTCFIGCLDRSGWATVNSSCWFTVYVLHSSDLHHSN